MTRLSNTRRYRNLVFTRRLVGSVAPRDPDKLEQAIEGVRLVYRPLVSVSDIFSSTFFLQDTREELIDAIGRQRSLRGVRD